MDYRLAKVESRPPKPALSFVTINDPGDVALDSRRKVVRSHAARYQYRQDALERERNPTRTETYRSRRRRQQKIRPTSLALRDADAI